MLDILDKKKSFLPYKDFSILLHELSIMGIVHGSVGITLVLLIQIKCIDSKIMKKRLALTYELLINLSFVIFLFATTLPLKKRFVCKINDPSFEEKQCQDVIRLIDPVLKYLTIAYYCLLSNKV
ncbi:MAG: hypothetical protein MHMPM18_003313 [Marteilia pararefringens]